jgi:hypothetical protein
MELSNYLLEDSLKDRLNFLILPFDRKVIILQSVIGNFNGLTYSEVKQFIYAATRFQKESIDRQLKEISDRQKLTYRNYPNISGRR